ncbi:MAG: DUF817 domain-containing protein [Ferruginibacter sp.]
MIDFITFGIKQILCCLFPTAIFILLAVSNFIPVYFLFRYDFLLLACLLVQYIMYKTGLETKDELLVICLFHILGLVMEIFKVRHGSWSYPEYAYSKVFNVPLYSGFMYASVASYMCQAWRRFDLKVMNSPNIWISVLLGSALYFNFFTHHFIPDLRLPLGFIVLIAYRKSTVEFTPKEKTYPMPVAVSFLLIGFFIWIAENMATFLGAWQYSYQHYDWQMVHFQKAGSWTLMAIVSYIIVSELKFHKLKNRS